VQPAQLLAGQRGDERRLAHQVLRGGLGDHLLLQAGVAQHLHRALVGDVRARRVGQPGVLGDHDVRYAVRAQQHGRRAARRPAADDENIGLDHACHGFSSADSSAAVSSAAIRKV
jgi:hypothetical protein